MWDEKQLTSALRKEIDGPAPAVRTQLSDIVPLGRRRRRIRHVGGVAAAVIALAGVGVLLGVVGPKDTLLNEPALDGPTRPRPPAELDWDRAPLPAHTPYSTWSPGFTAPPPPGREIPAIPMCDMGSLQTVFGHTEIPPELLQRLRRSVQRVARTVEVSGVVADHNAGYHFYRMDVTDSGGVGSVAITATTFAGTPAQAADAQAFEVGNCLPPQRTVRPDGTILQIYSVRPSEPYASLQQTVRVYRPDGIQYSISTHNWGSPDVRPDPRQPSVPKRIGAGRGTLPLTERQLAEAALGVI